MTDKAVSERVSGRGSLLEDLSEIDQAERGRVGRHTPSLLAYDVDQDDQDNSKQFIAEPDEVISDLSAEVKKYESESEEGQFEESSIGSLANRSAKVALAAKEVHDREKEKKKSRKKE